VRILFVCQHQPFGFSGGAEVYASWLMNGMAGRGHQPAVFYAYGEAPDCADIPCFQSAKSNPILGRVAFFNSYDDRLAAASFRKILSEIKPDVVHIHHLLNLSWRIVGIAKNAGVPVVATIHDHWFYCHRITLTKPDGSVCTGPLQGLACPPCGKSAYRKWPGAVLWPGLSMAHVNRNRRLKQALKLCDRVLVPSRYLLNRYQNWEPLLNACHWPYGIGPVKFEKKSSGPFFHIAYAAKISREKGAFILLKAARRLKDLPVRFLVAGGGSPEDLAAFDHESKDLNVIRLGNITPDRIGEDLLAGADILIQPSIWPENSPISIAQALAAGIPVIASRIGGIPEIVGEGGLLVRPDDPLELEWAIRGLVEDKFRLKTLRKNINPPRSMDDDLNSMEELYSILIGRA